MSQDKKTIFISYGRDKEHPEDVELIKKIKIDLEKDFIVHMDIFRLKTAENWANQLAEDIEESQWVLFFITPYSTRPTGFCHNELVYALLNKKSIASVMLREAAPPLSICSIQYLELQHVKENDDFYGQQLQELVSVLKGEKKQGFSGANASLYASLNPNKSKTIIADHINGFIGREWIYDKVDKWLKEEKDSRLFWITAEAGYGKTALAVYLSERHPLSTSIHFCQYDYKESNNPVYMLRILIYELSTQIEAYSKALLGINIEEKLEGTATHIFKELLQEPLFTIETPPNDFFFIIDALDEAKDENGNNPIADLISKRFSNLPKWLNIVITSRSEPELRRKLKIFNPIELKADEEKNLQDLKLYIFQEIKDLDNIKIEALIEKSEGNMLYLKSVLELDIIKEGNFTLENIKNLPQGMEGFYQQYFERKFDDMKVYKKQFRQFVNIMVASKEGLPLPLIVHILDIDEFDFEDEIKEVFGTLLEKNNDILTFYHKSLFDWLSDRSITNYAANIKQGNQVIVEKLWEVYKRSNGEDLIGMYEPYLLSTLYELKAYKKLNEILQDILLIGQMYNHNTHAVYRKILLKTIEDSSRECEIKKLEIYESFFREKEYLLLRDNNKRWKPHQTLLQLTYEDGDDSPLSVCVDNLLKKKNINFIWFKNKYRKINYVRYGILNMFHLNNNAFYAMEWLNGDKLVYRFTTDVELNYFTLILYFINYEGEILDLKSNINLNVKSGVLKLKNEIIFCYYIDENYFYLYDKDNKLIVNILLNENTENDSVIFSGKDIMTFSQKYSMDYFSRIWDLDGNELHKPSIHGNRKWNLKDGRILSLASDNTMKIIIPGRPDKPISTLTAHKGTIENVKILKDGRILSYDHDGTIILWDDLGGLIAIYSAHLCQIKYVMELNDKFLSCDVLGGCYLWSTKEEKYNTLHNGFYGDLIDCFPVNDKTYLVYSKKNIFLGNTQGDIKCLDINIKGYIDQIKIISENDILFSDGMVLYKYLTSENSYIEFTGHNDFINDFIELSDGRILSYQWGETKLILWEQDGSIVSSFEQATSGEDDYINLEDIKSFSYSYFEDEYDGKIEMFDLEYKDQELSKNCPSCFYANISMYVMGYDLSSTYLMEKNGKKLTPAIRKKNKFESKTISDTNIKLTYVLDRNFFKLFDSNNDEVYKLYLPATEVLFTNIVNNSIVIVTNREISSYELFNGSRPVNLCDIDNL